MDFSHENNFSLSEVIDVIQVKCHFLMVEMEINGHSTTSIEITQVFHL